nr:MAG TPA: hypothetical protein [Caudoviricetes sp.]
MAEVYATGLLTRVVDPGRLRCGRIVLDHLFWRILCQIRNIKYCAEPSVMEPPEHEGSLRNCYESRRPPRNTIRVFRRYITAQIKLLELRATLSDENNVIAKRGTRGCCVFTNPLVNNAGRHP